MNESGLPFYWPAILDDAGLDPYEVRVLLHLGRRQGRNTESWCGMTSMATACRMSKRSVMRTMRSLEKLQIVSIRKIRGRANLVRILPFEMWNQCPTVTTTSDSQSPGGCPTVTTTSDSQSPKGSPLKVHQEEGERERETGAEMELPEPSASDLKLAWGILSRRVRELGEAHPPIGTEGWQELKKTRAALRALEKKQRAEAVAMASEI